MSNQRSANVLLFPGLNGSGRFHKPFCAALVPNYVCQPNPLPNDGSQSYESLVEHFSPLLTQLTQPVALIGESFSGPLVYELALRFPEKVNAVIWAASFVANPRPLLSRVPVPAWMIHAGRYLPARPIFHHAFRGHRDEFWQVFLDERQHYDARVWQRRLITVSNRHIPQQPLTQPCLYLQASNDVLIRPYALDAVKTVAPSLTVKQINATHLLLQTNFQEAAKTVSDWLDNQSGK